MHSELGMSSRTARIFLSSTFRDFAEERDLLVRKVFPELRRRCRERQVELIDVDLRWGITEKQAQRGEVMPICMAEIDRSRPYFMGFIGERYGWVPEKHQYDPSLLREQPWLVGHRGGKSVTELEMLHGVLNNPAMAGRAFFYFRNPAYSLSKGGAYLSESSADKAKLEQLKDRIRHSGFPVLENYASPEALAQRVQEDLWRLIDESFPLEEVPDALSMERRKHEAYGGLRLRMYLGGAAYCKALDKATAKDRGFKPVLVTGASGGGKSALLANWTQAYIRRHPDTLLFIHYLGSGADAADTVKLVTRLLQEIAKATGDELKLESDPQKLLDMLPEWLARASSHAQREGRQWLLVFDGLDKVSSLRDLRWWPQFLPPKVKLIVSCLDGEVLPAARKRMQWTELKVRPLGKRDQAKLIKDYLAKYRKEITPAQTKRVQSHPLSGNPLFLRTLLEELRVFGIYEKLEQKLTHYLQSQTVDDLFERVLERIEQDTSSKHVRSAMKAIWASRAGLAQDELLAITGLVPATWAPIHNALDEALLESNGRLTFGHDYLRQAVEDRYLPTVSSRRKAHRKIAVHFDDVACDEGVDERIVEELPWQLERAGMDEELLETLTDEAMFEGLYDRNRYELLKYWLTLGEAPILQYEKAWNDWAADADNEVALASPGFRLAEFLRQSGSVSPFVEALYKRVFDAMAVTPDSRREDFLAVENSVALNYFNQGCYDQAEQLLRRGVAELEKLLRRDHPDTLDGINNLAQSLWRQGKNEEASRLYAEVLKVRSQRFGENHPRTISSLVGSGAIAEAMGDSDAALGFWRRALAASIQVLGENSEDSLGIKRNIANLLCKKGSFKEAETLHKQALRGFEMLLGSEHPETLSSVNSLATLIWTMGDFEEAQVLYRRALRGREKVLGSEHPDTLVTVCHLGNMLRTEGKYAAAEAMCRRALEGRQKALGAEHPTTLSSVSSLGALLGAEGNYAGAEVLYRRALEGFEKSFGPEHRDTLGIVNNFGNILRAKGDDEGAEVLYRRALEGREKTLEADHQDTLDSVLCLGNLLGDKGDYEEAEVLYRRAIEGYEQVLGAEHPKSLGSVNDLGLLLSRMKRHSEAIALLNSRAKLSQKAEDVVRYNLACYECLDGNLVEAERLVAKHLRLHPEMRHQALKDTDFSTIRNYIEAL